MNILGNTPVQALPPQLVENIQALKRIQNMPAMLQQARQMCQGQNPETFVRQLCQQKGIDFNAFMQALK